MRKNTATKGPVVLRSSDEWLEWYDTIRNVAIQQSVLEYCDPYKEPNEVTSVPKHPESPRIPGPKREKESVQEYTDRVNLYLTERKLYKVLDIDYKGVNKGLSIVSQRIGKSVDRSLLFYYWNDSSVYETLRLLRQRYEPTAEQRRETLRRNFHDARKTPVKMANIKLWTARYENAFEACKALKVLDVTEGYAIDQFFECVEILEPAWVERCHVWSRMPNASLSTIISLFLEHVLYKRSSAKY
ncbi:hypothetical protein BDW42DRAFT_181977 [Aspergillus taichungensis]|uniref:Uncharacterized protein n=1 Tax=Aspergillus taichungensis TaxID=482145 RepID=A0A2J5HCY4_9EURO|nr:hypothetical protein BDW42DRAFT_181977 [Aspergillus taichungensis]